MTEESAFEGQIRRGRARAVFFQAGEFGEQIAIAIVGSTDDGGILSRPVTPRIFNGLPRDLGHAVHSFGTLVAADYTTWCRSNRSQIEWTPPIKGLTFGDWIDVEGTDEQTIGDMLLGMCAFYESREEKLEEVRPVAPRSSEETRFLDSVKSEVERRRPSLTAGFRRTFSLTGKNIGSEIDFVGSSYATCYAAINPKGKPTLRIQTASAALWRLARAREAFGFAAPANVELTAWIPPPGQPIFTENEYLIVEETISELQEQAKKEELRVFPATSHLLATDRLIAIEGSTRPL
jgi:hypothetical protein